MLVKEAMMRKYNGVLLSPIERNILAIILYAIVINNPINMIVKYPSAIERILFGV